MDRGGEKVNSVKSVPVGLFLLMMFLPQHDSKSQVKDTDKGLRCLSENDSLTLEERISSSLSRDNLRIRAAAKPADCTARIIFEGLH